MATNNLKYCSMDAWFALIHNYRKAHNTGFTSARDQIMRWGYRPARLYAVDTNSKVKRVE